MKKLRLNKNMKTFARLLVKPLKICKRKYLLLSEEHDLKIYFLININIISVYISI